MENLTGGTPPVRYLPCVVPCKLYFLGGYGICSKKIAMRRYGERYKESVQFQN